jgi:hypothetical protein
LVAEERYRLKEIHQFTIPLLQQEAVEGQQEITRQVVGPEVPVAEEATQMPEGLVILRRH